MIATIDGVKIVEESDVLAKMVSRSEVAEHYRTCKYNLKADEEAQQLIQRFISMKEKYEEVQRFGKYHPEYTSVSTEIRVLKRELDLNDSVAEFKKAEKELETLLNEICGIIAHTVSENIKVPTGNPFFDNMSCGGGCGSGGSCGCG
jgi:cell fate (sporulation/competence/biofilm development) regulator YlbF (YheA/YmcA/DUF963 family)